MNYHRLVKEKRVADHIKSRYYIYRSGIRTLPIITYSFSVLRIQKPGIIFLLAITYSLLFDTYTISLNLHFDNSLVYYTFVNIIYRYDNFTIKICTNLCPNELAKYTITNGLHLSHHAYRFYLLVIVWKRQ